MIDTDKYEGHEPAPWEYSPDSQCILGPQNEETGNCPILVELPETACLIDGEWKVSKRIPNAKRGRRMFQWVRKEDYTDAFGVPKSVWWGDRLAVLPPTHRLMADAPLLLAEVKRLRKIVSVVEDAVKTHVAWERGESETFVAWGELVWELHDMLFGGEEE